MHDRAYMQARLARIDLVRRGEEKRSPTVLGPMLLHHVRLEIQWQTRNGMAVEVDTWLCIYIESHRNRRWQMLETSNDLTSMRWCANQSHVIVGEVAF